MPDDLQIAINNHEHNERAPLLGNAVPGRKKDYILCNVLFAMPALLKLSKEIGTAIYSNDTGIDLDLPEELSETLLYFILACTGTVTFLTRIMTLYITFKKVFVDKESLVSPEAEIGLSKRKERLTSSTRKWIESVFFKFLVICGVISLIFAAVNSWLSALYLGLKIENEPTNKVPSAADVFILLTTIFIPLANFITTFCFNFRQRLMYNAHDYSVRVASIGLDPFETTKTGVITTFVALVYCIAYAMFSINSTKNALEKFTDYIDAITAATPYIILPICVVSATTGALNTFLTAGADTQRMVDSRHHTFITDSWTAYLIVKFVEVAGFVDAANNSSGVWGNAKSFLVDVCDVEWNLAWTIVMAIVAVICFMPFLANNGEQARLRALQLLGVQDAGDYLVDHNGDLAISGGRGHAMEMEDRPFTPALRN